MTYKCILKYVKKQLIAFNINLKYNTFFLIEINMQLSVWKFTFSLH